MVVGASERHGQQRDQHAEVARRIHDVGRDLGQPGQLICATDGGDQRGHLEPQQLLARSRPQPIGDGQQRVEVLERDGYLERPTQQLLRRRDLDLDLRQRTFLQLCQRRPVVVEDQVAEAAHRRSLTDPGQ